MYCKLCGEHLYKEMSFEILFKTNYKIHLECEEKRNQSIDYITIPVLDKLLLLDYLFEEKYESSDSDFLYDKYSIFLFDRLLKSNEWSIVIFLDNVIDKTTISLIIELADKALLLLSVFNENFL